RRRRRMGHTVPGEAGDRRPPGADQCRPIRARPYLRLRLTQGEACDFGHHVFPAQLERGARVLAYELGEPVIDVGTPEGLASARMRVASRMGLESGGLPAS